MISRLIGLVLLLSSAAVSALSQTSGPGAQASKEEKPSEYATLLARAKAGDLTIDFKQLRFSYMESPERKQTKDTSKEEREIFKLLRDKDYKKAIEEAAVIIDSQFVNMDAHYVSYIAYRELQNNPKADFHRAIFAGLLQSITGSGDGKSKETAWTVINTHEEYVVLGVMGLRVTHQSLQHDDKGHVYDAMEVVDPKTSQSTTYYFNVDIPFKHYLN